MNLVRSGVNLTLNFPAMWRRLRPRSDLGCRRAQASQGQALRVAAKDAASLDRPCARRPRDLAVGTEECSRRGSNQRMDPIDCAGTCCERKIKPAGFRAKLNLTSNVPYKGGLH